MSKVGWQQIFIIGLMAFSPLVVAESSARGGSMVRWDSSSGNNGFHDPNFAPELNTAPRPRGEGNISTSQMNPDLRTYSEGVNELTIRTFTPFKVNVSAKFIQVVGSIDIQTRNMVQTDFEFRADNVNDDVNIWDDHGRAVLVPGTLICNIIYRTTLSEFKQAGVTLGLIAGDPIHSNPTVNAIVGAGGSYEKLNNDYFESTKRCNIGSIPKFTTQKQIANLCRSCHDKVLPTLKEDVRSRLNALTYLVNTPICVSDSECEQENGDWTQGRCVLVKDKNNSLFSECQARSKIGGPCSGKNSNGMFEYRCDKGLSCTRIHDGDGFTFWKGYDYSKYECRDPQNKEWKSEFEKLKALRRERKT